MIHICNINLNIRNILSQLSCRYFLGKGLRIIGQYWRALEDHNWILFTQFTVFALHNISNYYICTNNLLGWVNSLARQIRPSCHDHNTEKSVVWYWSSKVIFPPWWSSYSENNNFISACALVNSYSSMIEGF